METKCDLEHAVIHVCSKPLLSLSTLAHCPDLFHLTSKSNFRICLPFGCHGLESDASRLSTRNNGQLCGDPSCKLYGVAPEDATHFISTCTILETKCRELLSYASSTPPPPQSRDMDLPDPAREPDSFASIMLGIDWIEDIQIQVAILHQLSSRTQGFQSRAHPNVTSSHYLLVLSWNRRQQRKKERQ